LGIASCSAYRDIWNEVIDKLINPSSSSSSRHVGEGGSSTTILLSVSNLLDRCCSSASISSEINRQLAHQWLTVAANKK
jgi:hypothetical protein